MNHSLSPSDSLTPDELQRLLDRLVDGELSTQQQQALLRQLDQIEGGWRRCALAFVEAEVWRQELGDWGNDEPSPAQAAIPPETARPAEPKRSGGPATTTSGGGASWQRRAFTVLSMAASFVVAFVLGFALHPDQPGGTQVAGTAQPATSSQPINESMIATVPGQDLPSLVPQPAVQGGSAASTPSWGHVSLLVNDNGTWRPMELPAVNGVDAQRWLASQPSAVPASWKEQMQRQGHMVQTQRELVPLDLGDGRRLVVPVEQVEVQYVGGHRYQ